MLINLSNHNSNNWSEAQWNSATKDYNVIIDIDFPVVDPNWSPDEVSYLAFTYSQKCIKLLKNSTDILNAVHIMGEMTFCFALINILKKEGIMCVASTTERNTMEINGKKTSVFNFIKFREYQL